MSELSIVISGVIEKSNFDEWKTDLVEKIRSVNTELKTDDDFAAASKHVKQFKSAEKNLKAAKKSALEQAAEINQLFEAIDTVSEEARQARLKLDKQIKKRKLEIKQEFVEQGVDTITAFIAEQSDAFQSLAHSQFTDSDIFLDALSGKASTKGMQKAIAKTCKSIKESISKKAISVDTNATTLDNLAAHHKTLFQDRVHLIDLDVDQLNQTIDDRIKHFEQQSDKTETAAPKDAAEPEIEEKPADSEDSDTTEQDAEKSDYTVTIEINATEEEADAIRTIVVEALASNNAIGNITLSAVG